MFIINGVYSIVSNECERLSLSPFAVFYCIRVCRQINIYLLIYLLTYLLNAVRDSVPRSTGHR